MRFYFFLPPWLSTLCGRSRSPRTTPILSKLILAGGIVTILLVSLLPRQIVVNFNMQRSSRPNVIYHGEGVAHTVDIIRTPNQQTLMMINGNIEADTTLVQRRHFILKAHLPMLLHRDAKDVAVIGLGLGITLSAIARNPAARHIRLVELSPEMVRAHESLKDLTGDVLANPKVDLLIDDGRNFLNRSTESFDVITADPIHPRISGVGYLYSREYYEAVRAHLRPGGYILQWMPMYAISRQSFDVAFRTFASVFPNASFWYVRGHGLFVAGKDKLSLDFKTIESRFEQPAVRKDFESIGIGSAEQLIAHLLMDDQHIARYLQSSPGAMINTDDNAYLEYATPHEFLEKTKSIIESIKPFVGWDIDNMLVDADSAERDRIKELLQARKSALISELDEPIE